MEATRDEENRRKAFFEWSPHKNLYCTSKIAIEGTSVFNLIHIAVDYIFFRWIAIGC